MANIQGTNKAFRLIPFGLFYTVFGILFLIKMN